MFFILSKTLGALFMPVNLGLVLLAIGLLLRIRRRAARLSRWALRLGIATLLVFSLPATTQLMLWPLDRAYPRPAVAPENPVAIVMLTGMLHVMQSGDTLSDFGDAADRFFALVRLARRYPEAKVLILGGSGALIEDATSEGRVLARLAADLGVARSRILVDPSSRNTRENAVNGAKLLATLPPGDALLVTSAFHMPRAMACFAKVSEIKQKLIAWPVDFRHAPWEVASFIPKPSALELSTHLTNEYVGLVVYWVLGYI